MGRDEHHVDPNPENGWDVKRNGADRASEHFDTKQEAIQKGRDISQHQKTELVIHNEDGKISGMRLYLSARKMAGKPCWKMRGAHQNGYALVERSVK